MFSEWTSTRPVELRQAPHKPVAALGFVPTPIADGWSIVTPGTAPSAGRV